MQVGRMNICIYVCVRLSGSLCLSFSVRLVNRRMGSMCLCLCLYVFV